MFNFKQTNLCLFLPRMLSQPAPGRFSSRRFFDIGARTAINLGPALRRQFKFPALAMTIRRTPNGRFNVTYALAFHSVTGTAHIPYYDVIDLLKTSDEPAWVFCINELDEFIELDLDVMEDPILREIFDLEDF